MCQELLTRTSHLTLSVTHRVGPINNYPHSTEEASEVERAEGTCPKSLSRQVGL